MRGGWLLWMALAGVSAMPSSGQAVWTAKGPGSYIAVGGGAALYQDDYGQRRIAGIVGYANVQPTWRYGSEAEVRSLTYRTSEQVTETSYLIGPRVLVFQKYVRVYAKFLAGVGHIVLPYHYAEGNFLTYAPGGTIEYLVGDRIAVRVVDFEYQMWQKFPYGELHPYGVSAGISFRLNRMSRLPRR